MILSGTITLSPPTTPPRPPSCGRGSRTSTRAAGAPTGRSRPCSPPGAAARPTPSARGGRSGARRPPASSRSCRRRRRRWTWPGRRGGRRLVVRQLARRSHDRLRRRPRRAARHPRRARRLPARPRRHRRGDRHAQARLQDGWTGRATAAQVLSYDSWRDGCADMVTALAGAAGDRRRRGRPYSPAVGQRRLWQRSARDAHRPGRSPWRRRRTSARRPCWSAACRTSAFSSRASFSPVSGSWSMTAHRGIGPPILIVAPPTVSSGPATSPRPTARRSRRRGSRGSARCASAPSASSDAVRDDGDRVAEHDRAARRPRQADVLPRCT